MSVQRTGFEDEDWIHLAQYRGQRRDLKNTVKDLLVQ